MIEQLKQLEREFIERLEGEKTQNGVLALKSDYLGKKGKISEVLASLKDATPEQRKAIGPVANDTKELILSKVSEALQLIEREEINRKLELDKIDFSYRASVKAEGHYHGGIHPREIVRREIEEIFLSMGFEVLDGPHIDSEFYNFEALNIPGDHPARDMQDTFWFRDPQSPEGKKHLLRTHTSTIQIRGMLERTPPFRFIAPGTVFRCERTDASHEMVFQQLEGMLVGEGISVANLIYFMKVAIDQIFKKDIKIRLRPGFFPFVEPGFELDILCQVCQGEGCSVCKRTGWLELLPCGMVHPNVLKAGNIDPDKYNGFAFGLGLDRLVMMKYGIDDIRHLQSGDLRFNEQFKSY